MDDELVEKVAIALHNEDEAILCEEGRQTAQMQWDELSQASKDAGYRYARAAIAVMREAGWRKFSFSDSPIDDLRTAQETMVTFNKKPATSEGAG